MPATSQRGNWLYQARTVLADAYGPQAGPIVVTVANDQGQAVSYTLPAMPAAGILPDKLTPIHRAILEASRLQPQSAKRLAAQTRYKLNSYFRDTLRDLCRRQLLVHTPDGYRRPA